MPRTSSPLSFIFTEKGFRVDQGEDTDGFSVHPASALLRSAFRPLPPDASPSFRFLHGAASRYLKELTRLPELEVAREKTTVPLSDDAYASIVRTIPFALGAENITRPWLDDLFHALDIAFSASLSGYEGTIASFLAEKDSSLHAAERIYFHLVEYPGSDIPFAFMATYSTKNEAGEPVHLPLSYAMTEYKEDREKLLALLSCLNKAADHSSIIASFVASGELFHPLRLTADEALSFLRDIPAIEADGIICRIPDWWFLTSY